MTFVLAATVAAGIALPHVVRLQRVHPVTAAALWLSSLGLRALITVLGAVYLLFFLPRTELFSDLTHWCLHGVLPFLPGPLQVEGHGVGDLVLFVPGALLTLSLVIASLTTTRRARSARRALEQQVLGQGPRGSVIVRGHDVAFAVAGLARPRIVVTVGALARLDDEELAAALEHEKAHITRGHRFVTLTAIAFHALGQLVPGGRRALRELTFHLERDADRCALRQRDDRLALASVLCKAAGIDEATPPAVITNLDGAGVGERVGQLLATEPPQGARRTAAALNGLAVAMVLFTFVLAAMVPTAAVAGASADAHRTHHVRHCDH